MTSHAQLAHIWAQQSKERGKGPSMFFNGPVIYSYGYHFPLGIILDYNGTRIAVLNGDNYSVSTTRHQSYVSRAASHFTRIALDTGSMKALVDVAQQYNSYEHKAAPLPKHVKQELTTALARYARGEMIQAAKNASTRRKPELKASDIAFGLRVFNSVKTIADLYGVKLDKTLVAMREALERDASEVVALNAKQIKAAERKAKAWAKKEKARKEALAKEAAPMWLERKDTHEHRNALFSAGVVLLRVTASGENVETSQGAVFPLAHGLKALPLIRKIMADGEGWSRDGDKWPGRIALGHFMIDSISPDGVIKAGCHTLHVKEVERLAATLNA